MIKHCSKNITPDSITGMIFAMEGIKNVVVMLNGPMGCKFYHSTTSQFLSLRPLLYLPSEDGNKVPVDYNYLNSWFFRQQRVPCTYLDGYDYVYGTADKVAEGLTYLYEHVDFELLAIINSPGASLIGDNLQELADRILPDKLCVMLESPGYSRDYAVGYEEAGLGLLQQTEKAFWMAADIVHTEQKTTDKCINILGLSIWNRYFEGDKKELERLFALCGIRVNCFFCADCSLEAIRRLPQADLNVVIHPKMGEQCAQFLKQHCQTPYYICPSLPLGFQAVEQIMTDICKILGADCSVLIEESEKARALAWYKIHDIYQMCGLPKGVKFAVEGSSFEVYSYSRFFMEYLGMIPDCLSITDEEEDRDNQKKLDYLLEAYHAGTPQQKMIQDTRAELVFGNANTIAALKTRKQAFCGIEISLPGMGYMDILPKTHLGVQGSLFLIEQVLNGLMSKI